MNIMKTIVTWPEIFFAFFVKVSFHFKVVPYKL